MYFGDFLRSGKEIRALSARPLLNNSLNRNILWALGAKFRHRYSRTFLVFSMRFRNKLDNSLKFSLSRDETFFTVEYKK